MYITIDTRYWHARYESLPQAEQFAIDQAFDAAVEALKKERPG